MPARHARIARKFHVTSAVNRESILAHGLDWTRMGAAPGIAGSAVPEEQGVFLCRDEFEAGLFVPMNSTGGPVDVCAVTGIDEQELITTGSGFSCLPAGSGPARSLWSTGRRTTLRVPLTAGCGHQVSDLLLPGMGSRI